MSVIARNNFVIIEPASLDGAPRPSGLVIPAGARPAITTGTVVAIGPDVREQTLVVGAMVVYPPYGVGELVMVDGRELMVMLDHEILGSLGGV